MITVTFSLDYFSHGYSVPAPLEHVKSQKKISMSMLKVVSSEKVGWSVVTSTLGTLYGDVVMGILLSLVEAAI